MAFWLQLFTLKDTQYQLLEQTLGSAPKAYNGLINGLIQRFKAFFYFWALKLADSIAINYC